MNQLLAARAQGERELRLRETILGYAVRLRGIRVRCQVGVSDAERAVAQEVLVSVDVELAGARYPRADDLERAVDYSAIVQVVSESAGEREYKLVETLALRVARRVLGAWTSAERVRVSITKAHVPVSPTTDEASVEIVVARDRFGSQARDEELA